MAHAFGNNKALPRAEIDNTIFKVDEEISIGDYVLTNGAIAAVVLVDAIVRLIPGVLGDDQSAVDDRTGHRTRRGAGPSLLLGYRLVADIGSGCGRHAAA